MPYSTIGPGGEYFRELVQNGSILKAKKTSNLFNYVKPIDPEGLSYDSLTIMSEIRTNTLAYVCKENIEYKVKAILRGYNKDLGYDDHVILSIQPTIRSEQKIMEDQFNKDVIEIRIYFKNIANFFDYFEIIGLDYPNLKLFKPSNPVDLPQKRKEEVPKKKTNDFKDFYNSIHEGTRLIGKGQEYISEHGTNDTTFIKGEPYKVTGKELKGNEFIIIVDTPPKGDLYMEFTKAKYTEFLDLFDIVPLTDILKEFKAKLPAGTILQAIRTSTDFHANTGPMADDKNASISHQATNTYTVLKDGTEQPDKLLLRIEPNDPTEKQEVKNARTTTGNKPYITLSIQADNHYKFDKEFTIESYNNDLLQYPYFPEAQGGRRRKTRRNRKNKRKTKKGKTIRRKRKTFRKRKTLF